MVQSNRVELKASFSLFPFVDDFFQANFQIFEKKSCNAEFLECEKDIKNEIVSIYFNGGDRKLLESRLDDRFNILMELEVHLKDSDGPLKFIGNITSKPLQKNLKAIFVEDLINYFLVEQLGVLDNDLRNFISVHIYLSWVEEREETRLVSRVWIWLLTEKESLSLLLKSIENFIRISKNIYIKLKDSKIEANLDQLLSIILEKFLEIIFLDFEILEEIQSILDVEELLLTLAKDVFQLEELLNQEFQLRQDIIFWRNLIQIQDLLKNSRVELFEKENLIKKLLNGLAHQKISILKVSNLIGILFDFFKEILYSQKIILDADTRELFLTLALSLIHRIYKINPENPDPELIKFIFSELNLLIKSKNIFREIISNAEMIDPDNLDNIGFLQKQSPILLTIEECLNSGLIDPKVFFVDIFLNEIKVSNSDLAEYKNSKEISEALIFYLNIILLSQNGNERQHSLYPNLAYLFSIAYVKFIIEFHFREIIDTEKKVIKNYLYSYKEVNGILSAIKSENLKTILKIFILKVCRSRLGNNEELRSFPWKDYDLESILSLPINIIAESMLFDYEIFDSENFKIHKEIYDSTRFIFQNAGMKTYSCKGLDNFFLNADENELLVRLRCFLNIICSNFIFKIFSTHPRDSESYLDWHKDITSNLTKYCPDKLNIITLAKLYLTNFDDSIDFTRVEFEKDKLFYSFFFHLLNNIATVCKKDSFYLDIFSNYRLEENIVFKMFFPGVDDEFSDKKQEKINAYKRILVFFNSDEFFVQKQHWSKSIYICSCYYLYLISDCGGPMEIFSCPKCKNPIGGEKHKIFERKGHFRVFFDEKERERIMMNEGYYTGESKLRKDIEDYLLKQYLKKAPGEVFVPDLSSKEWDQPVRQMNSPFISALLGFISFSTLYLSWKIGSLSFPSLKKLVKGSKTISSENEMDSFLIDLLKEHYFKKLIMNNIPKEYKENSFLFLHLNVENFVKALCSLSSCFSPKERLNLEFEFEKRILEIINLSEDGLIRYKNESHAMRWEQGVDKMFSYLDESISYESANEAEYFKLNQRLFRYVDIDCKKSLEILKLNAAPNEFGKRFPYLSTFLKYMDELNQLNSAHKILNLSNKGIDLFNYRLSREDAKSSKIKEVFAKYKADPFTKYKAEVLEKCFQEFLQPWNEIIKKNSGILQFECNELKPLFELTDNYPVCYILCDDQEDGGMYLAAFKQMVINIQNKMIEMLTEISDQTSRDKWLKKGEPLPIDYAYSYEIVDSSNIKNIFNLVENHCIYNIEYGKCGRREFYYKQLNDEIYVMVFQRLKILHEKQVRYINYHFEIPKRNASLISEVRKIPQKNLEEYPKTQLENYLKNKQDMTLDFYITIQYLTYIAVNLIEKKPKQLISEIFERNQEKWGLNEDLGNILKHKALDFKLEHLENIFDIIEISSFLKIKETVPKIFKKELDPDLKKNVDVFFGTDVQGQNTIPKKVFSCALRRLISRYLIFCKWQPSDLLKHRLMYDDIWPTEIYINERLDMPDSEFQNKFPDDVKLEHTLELYNYFEGNPQTIIGTGTGHGIRTARQKTKFE